MVGRQFGNGLMLYFAIARKDMHGNIHCPCTKCGGKAVSKSTKHRHWKEYKEREEENRRLEDFDYHPEAQPVQEADEIYSDLNSERCELRSEDDLEYNPLDGLYSSSESNTSSVIESDQENNSEIERGGSIEGTSEVDHTNTGQYAPEDKLILYEVIRAFDLVDQMHGSHSDFNDLLEFARDLYCKDDVGLRQKWPKDYRAAKKLLYDLGFVDAKIYFVCLDDSHHANWDLLDNSTQQCKYCGKPGTIKFYYSSIKDKINK